MHGLVVYRTIQLQKATGAVVGDFDQLRAEMAVHSTSVPSGGIKDEYERTAIAWDRQFARLQLHAIGDAPTAVPADQNSIGTVVALNQMDGPTTQTKRLRVPRNLISLPNHPAARVRQGKIGVGDGDGQNRILLNAADVAGGIAFFKR